MKFARHLFVSAAALFAVLAFGSRAAQAETPHNDTNDHAKSMEDRISAVEKRMADFENRFFGPSDRYFAIPRENMDDMFNRMRREIISKGDAFNWDEFFGHGKEAMASKPRLGVELALITDELKTHYKNDVKAGAFVVAVEPNSPAEKAGIMAGDAIISFNGKAVTGPKEASDAIKSASAGSHDLIVERHGEMKALKVDLSSSSMASAAPENVKKTDSILPGWLWNTGNGTNQNVKSQTEAHVSALELSDALAKDLKLTDAQKKKMSDILATESKSLTTDFDKESNAAKGEELSFSNFSNLVQKHTDNAAKELAGVLDAGQLKLWNEYRQAHSSASYSQTITFDNPNTGANKVSSSK